MGAGGGAVAAAIMAAKAKRVQNIVDAFRVADATAPDRARSLAELGVVHDREADELTGDGALVAGKRANTWYLHEAGYIARRESQSRAAVRAVVIVVAIVALVLAVVAFGLSARTT